MASYPHVQHQMENKRVSVLSASSSGLEQEEFEEKNKKGGCNTCHVCVFIAIVVLGLAAAGTVLGIYHMNKSSTTNGNKLSQIAGAENENKNVASQLGFGGIIPSTSTGVLNVQQLQADTTRDVKIVNSGEMVTIVVEHMSFGSTSATIVLETQFQKHIDATGLETLRATIEQKTTLKIPASGLSVKSMKGGQPVDERLMDLVLLAEQQQRAHVFEEAVVRIYFRTVPVLAQKPSNEVAGQFLCHAEVPDVPEFLNEAGLEVLQAKVQAMVPLAIADVPVSFPGGNTWGSLKKMDKFIKFREADSQWVFVNNDEAKKAGFDVMNKNLSADESIIKYVTNSMDGQDETKVGALTAADTMTVTGLLLDADNYLVVVTQGTVLSLAELVRAKEEEHTGYQLIPEAQDGRVHIQIYQKRPVFSAQQTAGERWFNKAIIGVFLLLQLLSCFTIIHACCCPEKGFSYFGGNHDFWTQQSGLWMKHGPGHWVTLEEFNMGYAIGGFLCWLSGCLCLTHTCCKTGGPRDSKTGQKNCGQLLCGWTILVAMLFGFAWLHMSNPSYWFVVIFFRQH